MSGFRLVINESDFEKTIEWFNNRVGILQNTAASKIDNQFAALISKSANRQTSETMTGVQVRIDVEQSNLGHI